MFPAKRGNSAFSNVLVGQYSIFESLEKAGCLIVYPKHRIAQADPRFGQGGLRASKERKKGLISSPWAKLLIQ